MAFNHGDIVEHAEFGIGSVKQIREGDCYWILFDSQTKFLTVHHSELKSRPDLRPNEEGRRWCRPPVGIHKPYRNK